MSAEREAVDQARAEALRFLVRIAALEVCEKDGHNGGHYACPERASVLRASMDLTRALSKLRKS